jgi:molecular chaperone DnaK (HSP70)
MSNLDYLTEDNINPSNQKYVCISFLTDVDKNKTLSGIKIRGSFPSYESACEHAKKLQSIDNYFNVFVGEVGKWLPFDPNPDSEYVADSEYANEELNQMMKSYMENRERSNLYHEQRKQELVRQNIMDNLKVRYDNLEETHTLLNDTNNEQEKQTLLNNVSEIENQIRKMEERKNELDKQLDLLGKQLSVKPEMKLDPPNVINHYLTKDNNVLN